MIGALSILLLAPSRRVAPSLAVAAMVWPTIAWAQSLDSRQREGLHESPPACYVIQNATIHVDPETSLDQASLIIQNSKIVAVGKHVDVPDGAIVIDGTGKHVYPGFIDGCVLYGETIDAQRPGPRYWNERVRPEVSVADSFRPAGIRVDELRRAGVTAAVVAPRDGIIRGTSAVIHVANQPIERLVVLPHAALHVELTVSRRSFVDPTTAPVAAIRYPSSPMGAYALARQAFYDARWYRQAWEAAADHPHGERPEFNVSLEALSAGSYGTIVFHVSNEIAALRAGRFAREFDQRFMVLGSGSEYRRLQDIKALNAAFILPVDFPAPPQVADATAALDVTLETLMHWDHAPENPKRMAEAGIPFCFTTIGLSTPSDLLPNVRKAVRRGLDARIALAALTTQPAQLFGVDRQLGTLSPGKYASILMFDKPIFDDEAKLLESWSAGNRFIVEPTPARSFAGLWRFDTADAQLGQLEVVIRGDLKLSGGVKRVVAENKEAEEAQVENWSIRDTQLSGSFDAKAWGHTGKSLLSFVLENSAQASGHLLLPDGRLVTVTGVRVGEVPAEATRPGRGKERSDHPADDREDGTPDASSTKADESVAQEANGQQEKQKNEMGPALFPVNYPLGDFGRREKPDQPRSVLIHNVTVWTCGPEGVIPDGAILFGNGVIHRIFRASDPLPTADVRIDGQGGHVTPGLIDCHSHMATDSGINEGSQAITAEVRIGDFIDPRDINIYRQLAGGLTCANILHGSANPIGGQNQVIKLRWGGNDDELKFVEAPPGIKFALGENVKQSNRREPSTRYPQTRMGVEQIIHDAFRAAQEYAAKHERWRATGQGLPPRVDLELEALAEVVQGKRWIHCHSYRQDEILALIRVLDQYGIQIGTFQHILEGYKVAPEMARHGAMASAFSDWWAYKFEVYDAIPHAGALMHQAGIVVSFNSDDAELARHLNHEAAKAIRYGGLSEEEALKFVTLNPAKQLRIERWVGSLEPGKHADLVLWNGHPLSTMSRCEQTWIDGRKYFDRTEEVAVVQMQAQQRAALIQKVLESGESPARPGEGRIDASRLWPRYDEYCQGHRHSADCWHNIAESTCDACHQCSEDDWLCLFGYCQAARHERGACGQGGQNQSTQLRNWR